MNTVLNSCVQKSKSIWSMFHCFQQKVQSRSVFLPLHDGIISFCRPIVISKFEIGRSINSNFPNFSSIFSRCSSEKLHWKHLEKITSIKNLLEFLVFGLSLCNLVL